MRNHKLTLEEFKKCLIALDTKLDGEKLVIRAIGGFALMYLGIRKTGYTGDIDTVSHDFNPHITKLIEEVAKEEEIGNGWLNNDNVLDNDVENVERMLEPFWEQSDWQFENITLYVADAETLLRSKIIAAEDEELTGRMQDYPDMLDIFTRLGLNTVEACIDYCADNMDINLKSEYPNVFARLPSAFQD